MTSLTRLVAVALMSGPWMYNSAQAKDRILETRYSGNWDGRQTTIFVAAGDGSGAHQLLTTPVYEYSASFSRDKRWVVFTSERSGPANIYRVHPDGSGMERLTDNPGFDDQAALSPDGRQLAFVSSRELGTTDIWILDLASRRLRNLTHGAGGNFHPSWSPDGRWLAFSSDRDSVVRSRSESRFEEVQELGVFIMRPDGSHLQRMTSTGIVAGSPKWSPDGKRIVFYQTTANDAFDVRVARDFRLNGRYDAADIEDQIVSVDVATGKTKVITSGPGYKLGPQYVRNELAYVTRATADIGVRFTRSGRGADGEFRDPNWSTDGGQMVFDRLIARPYRQYQSLYGKPSEKFELLWSNPFPAVSRSGKLAVVNDLERADAVAVLNADGGVARVVSETGAGSALYPSWSPDEDWIAYGQGGFFTGSRRPAQVYLVHPDGSERHAVTRGPGNAGFPSFSPDGHHVVYRYRGDNEQGLRIVDIDDESVRELTNGPDNLPKWSPNGDLIAFTRSVDGDFDIYTIKPDGSDLRRLTRAVGHDAHCSWSPDGKHLVFSSARYGFKDESALYYDWSTQPYTELFVMDADGSNQRALTDNKWEDGTAAWLPD